MPLTPSEGVWKPSRCDISSSSSSGCRVGCQTTSQIGRNNLQGPSILERTVGHWDPSTSTQTWPHPSLSASSGEWLFGFLCAMFDLVWLVSSAYLYFYGFSPFFCIDLVVAVINPPHFFPKEPSQSDPAWLQSCAPKKEQSLDLLYPEA